MEKADTRCTARNGSGNPCGNRPISGATVCRVHGGSAPQVKKAAARRRLLEQAARDVQLWGGRKDVHPAHALLDLVQAKAAEVAYWESRVAAVGSHEDLLGGATEAAVPAMELQQLHETQRDLAAYATASLRAGVDSAMVQLAQDQAATIVAVLRAALTDSRVGASADVVDAVILEAVRAQALGR